MKIGSEAVKALHRFCVAGPGRGYMMFRAPDIDPCCIQIQGWEPFRRLHFSRCRPGLASWFRVMRQSDLSRLKLDELGPVANRFMNLSNGVEPTDQSQPTATKHRSPETGAYMEAGIIFAAALTIESRPCQHLTLHQFLAPRTAPRRSLLGS